jgi:hypothetical protein
VAGAAVGIGRPDGLCAVGGDADPLEWLALGVATLAVPPGNAVDVAGELFAGENVGSVVEGEDVVQAETAAEANTVRLPQATTPRLALSPLPAVVVRTFTEPPQASGRSRIPGLVPHQKPASEAKARGRSGCCPLRPKAGPRKRRGP